MDHDLWKQLYTEQPDVYERLVQYEDYEGNLIRALNEIYPLAGAKVVEFGAGTGRISAQLAPLVAGVAAFDFTPPMAAIAAEKRRRFGRENWLVGLADHRAMPVASGWADVAVEGWSFVHLMTWYMERWQAELGRAVDEMLRVVRPGGVVIMIETMGTGAITPKPPELHTIVHNYWEQKRSFSSKWIRTDFRFASAAEAREVEEPVFGEKVLESLFETNEGVILPECTGLWWREV